ncbi:hypothetical protein DZA31_00650 [Arcobacter sp. HD9-500m-PIT-SAG02]|nr:hypothetical protein DZA31_00650 [Arcobacter sp. HD9-500m-PIT-SAG02]
MYRKIITYLLFICSLLFALLFFLFEGVEIKSISLPGLNIKQLYIKLDKKLILDVDEIIIKKQSNVNNSLDNIKKDVYKIPLYLDYFQEIHIEKLEIDGKKFVADFSNDIISLDNKFINISAKPQFDKKRISLELYSLYLKDKDISLTGDVVIDYNNEKMLFNGRYSRNDLTGSLVFKADNTYIDFSLDSNNLDDIKFVKDFVELDETVEQWMYDNVLGTYKIETLTGRFSTRTFQPLLKSFKAKATVTNGKIKFHENLDYIKTDLVSIVFENDNLYFNMFKPKYKGIDIDGSNVVIHNIKGDGSNIDVNLLTKSKLNFEVLSIIEAYGHKLPIVQLDGQTNSKLTINVDFLTSKVTTSGVFETKEANFKLNDLVFKATNGKVELQDNIVYIKNTQVNYKDNLEASLDMMIDTETSRATGNTKLKYLTIKSDKQGIINLVNKQSSLSVDYSRDVNFVLNDLDTSISINDQTIDVHIGDLEKLSSSSELLQNLGVNNGELFLGVNTLDNIDFKANVFKMDLPLKRNGELVTKLDVEGSVKDGVIDAYTTDKKLLLHMTPKIIDLEVNETDLVIDVKKTGLHNVTQTLKLLFKKSNITINDEYSFNVDNFNIMKNKDSILLSGYILNPDLPLLKDGKKLDVLHVIGDYSNKILNIRTKDDSLALKIKEDKQMVVTLKNLDVLYNSKDEKKLDNNSIVLNGVNSSLIMNNKYKLLSDKYNFVLHNKKISFDSFHKNSLINLKQDENGFKVIKGINLSSEIINEFLTVDLLTDGLVNLESSGFKDKIEGDIVFTDNKIKNLAFLTNLILFLNTSPVLINPLFALPTVIDIASNKGLSTDGYFIKKGNVKFVYDLKEDIFNATQINTKGATVDFDGNAVLDFKKSTITSSVNVGFLKTYTNLVKDVPVLGYVLLGKDEKVTTKVDISGDLNKPEYKTNFIKDGANLPLDVIKRIISLPKKAVDSIIK